MDQPLAQWLPHIVAVVAVACSMFWLPPMDAVILVFGHVVLAVCLGRLLQAAGVRWWWRRHGNVHGKVRADGGGGCDVHGAVRVDGGGGGDVHGAVQVDGSTWRAVKAGVLSALVACVLALVNGHQGRDVDLLERLWTLALLFGRAAITAVPLAFAFEISGTPRAELADALSENQTSYSEGAAWLFFLGYLEKIFGDNGMRFSVRMDDYLGANEISKKGRENTCRDKMFILVPMKRVAILSDKDLESNDRSIKKERPLRHAAEEGGRKFSELQVYQVTQGGLCYRMAMEEATPLRTASLAVEDADADFDNADYEEFAVRFLTSLNKILDSKQAIGSQLVLVPIDRADQVGRKVVQQFRKLQEDEKKQEQEWEQKQRQEKEQGHEQVEEHVEEQGQAQAQDHEQEHVEEQVREQEQVYVEEQEQGQEPAAGTASAVMASREPEEISELDSDSWH